MRPNINLLEELPNENKPRLSFVIIVRLLLFLILILLVNFVILLEKNHTLKDELHSLEDKQTQYASDLLTLTANNPQLELNDIDKAAKQLAGELESKKSLHKELEKLSRIKEGDFAEYFKGLSRQAINGVWLENIVIKQGGQTITLKGKTLHADLLPEYLQSLDKNVLFKGDKFNTLELTDNKNKTLNFTISTVDANG